MNKLMTNCGLLGLSSGVLVTLFIILTHDVVEIIEPNRFILISEMVVVGGFLVLGLFNVVRGIRG